MEKTNTGPETISIGDMQWKGISLTQAAAEKIVSLTQSGQFFYFNVKVSGCTGFAYDVSLIEAPKDDDLRFESFGIVFYVALKAMPMIDGTEIDFIREGLNQTFVYRNPNVKSQCGCGESFGV